MHGIKACSLASTCTSLHFGSLPSWIGRVSTLLLACLLFLSSRSLGHGFLSWRMQRRSSGLVPLLHAQHTHRYISSPFLYTHLWTTHRIPPGRAGAIAFFFPLHWNEHTPAHQIAMPLYQQFLDRNHHFLISDFQASILGFFCARGLGWISHGKDGMAWDRLHAVHIPVFLEDVHHSWTVSTEGWRRVLIPHLQDMHIISYHIQNTYYLSARLNSAYEPAAGQCLI